MDDSLDAPSQPKRRDTPQWLRIGVWVAIVFLTLSVITGMLLY